MTAMLTLQRRHSPKCPDQDRGPNYLKCRGGCLLRACGTTADGRRMRRSLKTRDLKRAARRLTEIEDRMSGKPRKPILDAVDSFKVQHEGNGAETKRSYGRLLRYFTDFCTRDSLTYVDQVDVEAMDRYAPSRNKMKSWTKDVELLRQFEARRAAVEDITSEKLQLQKKFRIAVKQYISRSAASPAALKPELAILAFGELLKTDAGQITPSVSGGNTQEDAALNILSATTMLRNRFEAGLLTYITHKSGELVLELPGRS